MLVERIRNRLFSHDVAQRVFARPHGACRCCATGRNG